MKKISKKERIMRAINFEETDKIPYSIWTHYPNIDFYPEKLAIAQVKDAYEFDFDFIKIANNGLYSVLDYGTEYLKNSDGTPFVDKYGTLQIKKYGIESIEDIKDIKVLDINKGSISNQLKVLYHIKDLIKKNNTEYIPVVMTLYSPLTTAYKLSGNLLLDNIKNNSTIIHEALKTITESTIKFVKESINLGVDGFFFASQLSNYSYLSEMEYDEFGNFYDMKVFEDFIDDTFLNIVHIHGENAMFDKLSRYPGNCISWHDRWVGPSLVDARSVTDKCLLGGIDEENIFGYVNNDDFETHIIEALKMGGSKGFILGPGCTAKPNLSREHIDIIKRVLNKEV